MGLKVKDPNGEWRSTGGGGGASITVDDALNPDSTNPVQNKVIFAYLEEATNVLEQILGSIPSDDHINGLIGAYIAEALGGEF
jgi:hypothetical protein